MMSTRSATRRRPALHLIKAFSGWPDQRLPDGTLIWTASVRHR